MLRLSTETREVTSALQVDIYVIATSVIAMTRPEPNKCSKFYPNCFQEIPKTFTSFSVSIMPALCSLGNNKYFGTF